MDEKKREEVWKMDEKEREEWNREWEAAMERAERLKKVK